MPRGGKRPGAGRKPGSKTKKTMDIALAAAAAGETPLEYLLRVMRDPSLPDGQRMDAAKNAAPYCHSRLNAVTVKGDADGPLVVEIIRRTYSDEPVLSDPYTARSRADDTLVELAAARARLVEMTRALPLLDPPDDDGT
jgi:hypothetical protein